MKPEHTLQCPLCKQELKREVARDHNLRHEKLPQSSIGATKEERRAARELASGGDREVAQA